MKMIFWFEDVSQTFQSFFHKHMRVKAVQVTTLGSSDVRHFPSLLCTPPASAFVSRGWLKKMTPTRGTFDSSSRVTNPPALTDCWRLTFFQLWIVVAGRQRLSLFYLVCSTFHPSPPSFISAAVIKYPNKGQLRGERVYFSAVNICHLITEKIRRQGIWNSKSCHSCSWEQREVNTHTLLLACLLVVSSVSLFRNPA